VEGGGEFMTLAKVILAEKLLRDSLTAGRKRNKHSQLFIKLLTKTFDEQFNKKSQ
jgi:hypothetical protein